MFENLGKFIQLNPVMIIVGVVIFIVLGLGFFFYIRRRGNKERRRLKQLTEQEKQPQGFSQPVASAQPIITLKEIENPWPCKCGQSFPDEITLKKHVFENAVQEKGKHGKLPPINFTNTTPGAAQPPTGVCLKVSPNEKYRAVIRRYSKFGQMPVIEFTNRIDKELGNIHYFEPSCPISGEAFYIKENVDGSYSPYEPRDIKIVHNETPGMCYNATHWLIMDGVWIFEKSAFQLISKFIVLALVFGTIIICIIKVGG